MDKVCYPILKLEVVGLALGRGSRYPVQRSVWLSAETDSALRAASERTGIAVGVLVREAVEAGLRTALERRRSRARSRRSGK